MNDLLVSGPLPGLAALAADVAGHLFGLFDIGKAMQGDFDPFVKHLGLVSAASS
jgi:hypothetical protein